MSKKKRSEKRKMINQLFDAVADEKGIRDKEIFRRCYEEISRRAFSEFLREVPLCPEEVITYCQALLAPAAK